MLILLITGNWPLTTSGGGIMSGPLTGMRVEEVLRLKQEGVV